SGAVALGDRGGVSQQGAVEVGGDQPDSHHSTVARAGKVVAMTTHPPAMEVLPWQRFGEAVRDLARTVHESGWMPDLVIAVARGGLVPAGSIAYALGVNAMGTMNVEFYTDVEETLPDPVVLPPL